MLKILGGISASLLIVSAIGMSVYAQKDTRTDKHEHTHIGINFVKTKYTCSMHPEVQKDAPGNCPTCHMKLVPATLR